MTAFAHPSSGSRRHVLHGLLAALAVLAVDQLVKWYMLAVVMQPPRIIEVTGFFRLVMVWNRGISFGLFGSDAPHGPLMLSVMALVVCVVLGVFLWRAHRPALVLAFGAIIGGAVGNVIDRIRFGAVADFFDLHVAGYHWPAFNIADIAITGGVIVLLIDGLFEGPESTTKKP